MMRETRSSAEAFFTESWQDFMVGKCGQHPAVSFFECPVIVDNHRNEVLREG